MTGESARTVSASASDRSTADGSSDDVGSRGDTTRSGVARRRGTTTTAGAAGDTVAGHRARWCGVGALVAVAGTVLLFVGLHVLPPTNRISPVTRTISEYALTSSAWAFNLGVLLLVLASVAVFGGLAVVGRFQVTSVATVFGALWAVGLLAVVSFPKHNWALGTISTSGQLHRLASLVAFLALPVAVITIARRRGQPGHPASARCAFWLAVLSLAWFSPLVFAVVTAPLTGTPWWQAIPLGLVERGLALTEVAAVAALAALLIISARRPRQLRTAEPMPGR